MDERPENAERGGGDADEVDEENDEEEVEVDINIQDLEWREGIFK